MKLLKLTGVILLTVAFLFSCNKDNDNDINDLQTQLDIEETLKDYNATIISNNGKGKFWKIVGIIAADVAGGALGSLINPVVGGVTAAAASAAAGSTAPSGTGDPNFEVRYELPYAYETWDIGNDHNDILGKVYHGTAELNQYVLDNYGRDALASIQTEEMTRTLNITNQISLEYAQNGFDHKFLVQQFVKNDLIQDNVAKVLSPLFDGLNRCETDQDVSKMLRFYSDSVLKSDDLSASDKEAAFRAFSVLRSSANYWSQLSE